MKFLIFLPAILGLVFSTIYCVKRLGLRGLLWPITLIFTPDYFLANLRWAAVVPFLILLIGFFVSGGLATLLDVEF